MYVLATGNEGKVVELQAGLADLNIELKSMKSFGCESPEETGLSFVENALLKARHASLKTNLPAIADDSGIVINTLDGRPGVISARYAGPDCNNQNNIDKVLTEMQGKTDRQAFFYCALVCVRRPDDAIPIIAEGLWHGEIATAAKGTLGFGYDPIFYVPEFQCTAGELDPNKKNAISHRGRALEIFKNKMKAYILNT